VVSIRLAVGGRGGRDPRLRIRRGAARSERRHRHRRPPA